MAYDKCRKLTDSQAKCAKVLCVTLSSKVPVHLKCGELCTLKSICHTKRGVGEFQVLVGGAEENTTPGSLIIYDQIVDVKSESHNKFKVVVKNILERDLTLYPKTVIAECFPIDWAIPVTPSKTTCCQTLSLPRLICFW